MKILGIRVGHDSSAALVIDGRIVADVAEERFTRQKNDASFPYNAIRYCLTSASLNAEDLDFVAIPEDHIPLDCATYFQVDSEIPVVHRYHQFKKQNIFSRLSAKNFFSSASSPLPLYFERLKLNKNSKIILTGHHDSHAFCATLTAGQKEPQLSFVLDGRGGGISVSIWSFDTTGLRLLYAAPGSGSLGWFYSNCTEGMLWRHGCDEWKLMGLAPYGQASVGALKGFYPEYSDGYLTTPHDFGEFKRVKDHGGTHYHGQDAEKLKIICDDLGRETFAAEAQRVLEEQALNIILPWIERTKIRNLSCAGGVFLNVKLNQRIWESGKAQTLNIYPNPGDSGLAVGSALAASFYSNNLAYDSNNSKIRSLATGPEFTSEEIEKILQERQIKYTYHEDVTIPTTELLLQNKVIGWFQGRMEAGPRALGQRSIIMSPTEAKNKDIINAKIKFREAFRPFCPSILLEDAPQIIENPRIERFMLATFTVKPEWRNRIPAVVHADNTTRPQMVDGDTHPLYHQLISRFKEKSGIPLILNTSFNVKGEPIVCTPREAIKCFFDTGIDALVLGNFLIEKSKIV